MEIWINPDCSKCLSALTLLDAEQAQYTVRRYLDDPPNALEIGDVLRRLRLEPWDITRLGEPAAAELGLETWPRNPDARERWIRALASHPTLIQRPIITVDDDTAVIARAREDVLRLLERRP